ncbi:hypothetical protein CRV08_04140 [Halarcobacter ebronensis]|uniref:Uncharacterized protein n=1 Tax=Halarcobacter ebronensis TaxID=1462615 RepID=A0A4Q0YG81_9BACT|nr:hypothetical protein [Halarcobacter ebronensis]RXJ69205.1 hypothetical protein CRV08_04140 [Halarcobacter ebronensis]
MKDFNNLTTTESFINYYKKDSNNIYNNFFQKNKIVDLITKYELYYQISLGNFIFETFLDQESTVKKLEELNLYITPEIALFNIYKIIEENQFSNSMEKELENLIKRDASLKALEDFVTKDKDLLGAKYYISAKKEDILKDKFFNKIMQYNFESNYQRTFEHYNLVVSDKFIQNLQIKILEYAKETI